MELCLVKWYDIDIGMIEGEVSMNISQLKYVLEIANSTSIREAATKLFISQPALSASVRDLEEELGILIFARTNKGISLTNEGREFVTYAKKVTSQYAIMEERYLSRDSDKERFSVSTQHYNFAIKAFTKVILKYDPQKYAFSIHETKTREVLEDVRTLKSEVGIVSFSGSNKDIMQKLMKEYNLEFTPLMVRNTYIYVWEDHEFAGREEISIDELADYPCITFDQSDGSNFYLTEEAMADYDFAKSIKSDDRATTMEMISELHGYSIGSGMLSGEEAILKGMVSIKLKEEDPLTIGYIVRKDGQLSKYGLEYIEELTRHKEI
ncbi:MAG: LysR family transcriptional regulator [Lachnospiraceae bacterium]|nr:LysR family transcriptional regulator [Lachnospiraceae bacterium]